MRGRPVRLSVVLVAGALSATGATAAATSYDLGPPRLPGTFRVAGGALVVVGKVRRGPTIAVFARPETVSVAGCSTTRASVTSMGRLTATLRCPGVRGAVAVAARLVDSRLVGTVRFGRRLRHFTAAWQQPPGVALAAPATVTAGTAIPTVTRQSRHPTSSISIVRGEHVIRAGLEVGFRAEATAGDVDAVLDRVGGRITSAIAGVPSVVVSMPDPGTVAALDRVLAVVSTMHGVAWAHRLTAVTGDDLGSGFSRPPTATQGAAIHHLIALRFPAAWNARALITTGTRPTVVVADAFGGGRPSRHLDATYDASAFAGPGALSPHGYHVAGIIAGDRASDGSATGRVTGAFPSTTPLVVVDAQGAPASGVIGDLATAANDALLAARRAAGNVVLNTSIGSCAGDDCVSAYARQEGADWVAKIRALGLEDRMLQLTSAGNIAMGAPDAGAVNMSRYSAAGLATDLVDGAGAHLAPARDVLSVENVRDQGSAPRCLSIRSASGGSIAAIGSDVYSFTGPATAGPLSGTSMAAPEAAGLAEYVWTLAPTLTAAEVGSLLVSTARPGVRATARGVCSATTSAPVVDAYAAVLSLDGASAPTAGAYPIRLALLDRNGDGAFTDADLGAWADVFSAGSTATYGRGDLNGDDIVGGRGTAPFDLDRRGSTRYGTATLGTVVETIEGQPVSFDEHAISDRQILCYYAYSGLYTGSAAGRTARLGDTAHCGSTPALVVLTSRSVSTSAAGSATTTEPDGTQHTVSDSHVQVAPTDTFETFSGAASAAGTVTDSRGNTGSFLGGAAIDESTSSSTGTPLSLQSSGSCHAELSFTGATPPSGLSINSDAGSSMVVRFTINGAPLHYDLGSTGEVATFRNTSDFSPIAIGSGSGIVPPGTYDVGAAAICGAGFSDSYSVSLTLTP